MTEEGVIRALIFVVGGCGSIQHNTHNVVVVAQYADFLFSRSVRDKK